MPLSCEFTGKGSQYGGCGAVSWGMLLSAGFPESANLLAYLQHVPKSDRVALSRMGVCCALHQSLALHEFSQLTLAATEGVGIGGLASPSAAPLDRRILSCEALNLEILEFLFSISYGPSLISIKICARGP